MKKLFLILLVIAFTFNAYSQVSATSTATATIVAPITISKVIDLNFGNVAVGNTSGTVKLTPAGVRSSTGGAVLTTVVGTVSAASFTTTGQVGSTYSITLPNAPTTLKSGGNTMTCDQWTSSPRPDGILTTGTQTITVGATLNVTANQATGVYISTAPFPITVNYN